MHEEHVRERAYWLAVNKGFLAGSIVNKQDVVRLYGTATGAELSGAGGVSAQQLFVAKTNITVSCLVMACFGEAWINVMNHDDVVAKQKDEMKLNPLELSEAENRFRYMTKGHIQEYGPISMTKTRKPAVKFTAGETHIYFHLDLRKHAPSLKTTQLFCADIKDPENWKLLNPRIVQEDNATQICVVYTSPIGGYFVAPGTYWFKFRRVSENAAGDDSATSAWVEVV